MDKDKARNDIADLVEKYNKVVEDNRLKTYNEEMTKKDFIRPLFDALGWNTTDSREVAAEEKVSKGRVDYSFKIDGIPKFFLEAKSLKVDLDKEKYFEQAISYAWHKGCTWAVLTDFEAVKILNAEWKAANYLQSHFTTITYDDFLERFDDLWLLSKESFEKGLLDETAERRSKKTKKATIDEQLLDDFTKYRRMLTKSITKLNVKEKLSKEELDESVQRILDRLIFIRNCEDKELEEKLLISKLREWRSRGRGKLVKSLREIFSYFDEHYDSKIFTKHLCDQLEIDNEILSEIIKGLYFTKEKYFSISYDFSVIDADVLGNIYEQYLSHILKKTAKRAKVTKNGMHRKEQGIYYTPTYVVDYIVKNTLGKLLENKRINVETIRVLDPACGSGSFLIKAFDILNEHYRKNEKGFSQIYLDSTVGVPFTKRVKILQDNIFGVDLDKQAVEIAQLNLLLKIADKGHRLPLLEQNIKCGNSLINNEEIAGDKAFKWEEEFKDIMMEGGFDVVVGNPPYVNIKEIEWDARRYFEKKYQTARGRFDLFTLFIEQAFDLTKKGGYLAFIIPTKYLNNIQFKSSRKLLVDNGDLNAVYVSDKVFSEANVNSIIIVFRKLNKIGKYKSFELSTSGINKIAESESAYIAKGNYILKIEANKETNKLIKKIEGKCIPLKNICAVKDGIVAGEIKDILFLGKPIDEFSKPLLFGKDVSRYFISRSTKYVNYKPEQMMAEEIKRKKGKRHGLWMRKPEIFERPKILTRKVGYNIIAGIDFDNLYYEQTLHSTSIKDINYDLKFILALLNCRLFQFYYKITNSESGSLFPQVRITSLKKLPIKPIDKSGQQVFVKLVDEMLSLNKHLNELGDKKTDERARLEKKVKKVDRQIDELVYKIYGITEKEQKIIDGTDM